MEGEIKELEIMHYKKNQNDMYTSIINRFFLPYGSLKNKSFS